MTPAPDAEYHAAMKQHQPASGEEESVYTVSQLNRDVRFLLEDSFPSVLVEGELSNVAMPSSGHWYFTLKDDRAQVRCAMFRNRNMRVRFRPEEGTSIRVRARLSLYEGRGDYQLIVDRMEAVGDGALRRAFEELKTKLHGEGLFDEAHKKPLPEQVRHIGVITSPTGAAIRDIISTLRRRFPAIRVTILPVSVQGQQAAPGMIEALRVANAGRGCLADLDVLIIGRGGGSLEDLWSFNDEQLARAVFHSELPVVSAVGHEVDFSIVDFVADLRAATPTAAAELLSPDQAEYLQLFRAWEQRFTTLAERHIATLRQRLAGLTRRLRHPGRRLQEQAQSLDRLETRLQRALRNRIRQDRGRLQEMRTRLRLTQPARRIAREHEQVSLLRQRLDNAMEHSLQRSRDRIAQHGHALHAVSPLATLARGYSITLDPAGTLIRRSPQLAPGMEIETRLGEGSVLSTVNAVKSDGETPSLLNSSPVTRRTKPSRTS